MEKYIDLLWLFVTQHYANLNAVMDFLKFTIGSVEKQQAFFLQVKLFNKPDKLCCGRRQPRRDQKGSYLGEKRERLTPLNQLYSKYFVVQSIAAGMRHNHWLTLKPVSLLGRREQTTWSDDKRGSISKMFWKMIIFPQKEYTSSNIEIKIVKWTISNKN